jgi:AraC-like DNA-binding protein
MILTISEPLQSFTVMSTQDAEVARHALLGTFGATGFELRGRSSEFRTKAGLVRLGDLSLSFCRYDEPVRLTFPEASFVRQQICLDGSSQSGFGNRRIELDAQNWSATIPAGVDVDFQYSSSFRQVILWIESAALDRAATAMFGRSYRLSWEAQPNESSVAMQSLRRAIGYLASVVEIAGKGSPPVAMTETQDLVLANFLLSHQPQLIDCGTGRALLPSSSQMRVLEEYLIAHWNEPVTIEKLAQLGNVSVRSIFRYFKSSRGCTPLDFLKTLRLENARKMLLDHRTASTVSSVALRCGFNNMGHFAKDYRKLFGELPSQTRVPARQKGRT